MAPETRERICTLLSEVLALLDQDRASIAAIHIAHAMDAMRDNPIDRRGSGSSTALQ